MKHSFGKHSRAFSLVELSVVIVIIGIFIAGVIVADSLVKKFRIQSAQALTKSSPITGITENAIWLESSLDSSFLSSESNNSSSLSTWNDQSVNATKYNISQVGIGPIYSNTINSIHAVKFSGSTANYLKISDASFLNNTDYTIFVLEKRQSANAGYFLSSTDVSDTTDNKLSLGYVSDGVVAHSHNSVNYAIPPKVSAYADSTDKPRIFAFVQDSVSGKKTYINGTLSAQDATNVSQLSGVTTLAIGKGYTGEIGEIAIFTKVLTTKDRESVEDYLGKKWTRKINRSAAATCVNGVVTDSGCSNVCSTSVVAGVVTPTEVPDGATGSLSCTAGYSGSVSYNCSNGNLNPVGSCSMVTCSASGTGYSKTGLAYATSGTGSFSCDAGYSGTINYTCTSAGAATGITGTCTPVTCTASAGTGYSSQTNLPYTASGSGSFSCSTGYTGTINYTCTSAGAATGITGTCTPITCTAPAATGYLSQTNLAYAASGSGTFSCDTANGYTGTVSYTCTSSGVATDITSTCSDGTPCTCSGCTTTTVSGTHTLHVFSTVTTTGSLNCTSGAHSGAKILVVGGGGSGGAADNSGAGGGGGGGGVVYAASYNLAATTYSNITVGAGGASVTASTSGTGLVGNNGGDSIFGTLTAKGGGGGGTWRNARMGANNGGSGGGSGGGIGVMLNGTSNQTTQTNESNHYGNSGGTSTGTSPFHGGGGGGAGGAGGNATASVPGVGGNGILSTEVGGSSAFATATGITATYGAGGGGSGGGGGSAAGAAGGSSVGGTGGTADTSSTVGTAGSSSGASPNIHAGNGGGGSNRNNSGAGSKGIVIIYY